jgi:thiamine biosynthesis lipoprotein
MRAVKRLLCIVLLISTTALIFSCSKTENKPPKTRTFYTYFNTVGTFYDYTGGSTKKFEALADRVELTLREYHRLFDIYREYEDLTNLATINRTAGNGPVKVDKKIIDLLLFSKEMYNLTSGKVNIAMGSVLSIWHGYRTEGKSIPPMDILREAAKHTDINSVIIDEENMTVELLDPEMSLDVGAIAKGYAVEMVSAMLEAEGKSGYILDVGRNLRTIGKKPSGDGWTAGVINPIDQLSNYVYITKLTGDALVTSGSYERFYTVDGVRYHHIINGDTLMPENYYLSVSVKSDSSALSDALSTAIFNMQYEEAESFVSSIKNIFVILVMPNGEVITLGNE